MHIRYYLKKNITFLLTPKENYGVFYINGRYFMICFSYFILSRVFLELLK